MDVRMYVISVGLHFIYRTNTSNARTVCFEVICFLVFPWNFVVRSILLKVQIPSDGLKEAFPVHNEPEPTSTDNSFACVKYRKYKNYNTELLNCNLLFPG